MKKQIKVAAIQIDCYPEDKQRNLRHAELMIRRAAAEGAVIVLLPELSPSGYHKTLSSSSIMLD